MKSLAPLNKKGVRFNRGIDFDKEKEKSDRTLEKKLRKKKMDQDLRTFYDRMPTFGDCEAFMGYFVIDVGLQANFQRLFVALGFPRFHLEHEPAPDMAALQVMMRNNLQALEERTYDQMISNDTAKTFFRCLYYIMKGEGLYTDDAGIICPLVTPEGSPETSPSGRGNHPPPEGDGGATGGLTA